MRHSPHRTKPTSRKCLAGALAFLALAAPRFLVPQQATAAPITDFDPGFLISDVTMYNYQSMTLGQIDQFIATLGAQCVPSAGNTCLKDYRENTPTRPATEYCPGGFVGTDNDTVAAIIFKAATACRINPQVLLVTLQKEQSLILANQGKPTSSYAKALGFGCPDSTPGVCNAAYAGFANQVYSAASRLQQYAAQPWNFNHRVGQYNKVLYHPNEARCGSAQVFIKTQATASLYNYTPYQPNGPALAAGGGAGDKCSSYGNRNFHIYFNAWFGDPKAGGPVAFNPINRLPIGAFDAASSTATGQLIVEGWAFDIDTASAIDVQIFRDGKLNATAKANTSRPDVQAVYQLANANHGFAITLPNQPLGEHDICLQAVNVPAGKNVAIGCKKVFLAEQPIFPVDAIDRLAGRDRYATAAVIAQDFAPDATTVFITTGQNFPDALTAAAAAQAKGAPLLLYDPNSNNTPTLSQLKQLTGLNQIYVFGGGSAIPPKFVVELRDTFPNVTVTRIPGKDRYETASLTAKIFYPKAEVAFVATANNFPDALAAAAAAGSLNAPVLLVGNDIASTQQAASVLMSPWITEIYVIGSTGVISDEIAEYLGQYGRVERIGGADRYATAAEVARRFFPTAATAFIATGKNFPDALAGAAAAGQLGAPLLLSSPWQLGEAPKTYLTETETLERIYLLGGNNVLFPGAYPAN